MTLKNQLINKAIAEFKKPTIGTTKQYLEVLEVELENGLPKVERVDFDSFEETNVVYFSIKNEPFFLSVYFSKDDNEITYVGTENGNQVYFTATSETLSYDQLSKLTTLKGLKGWNIGDERFYKNGIYDFSRITFEPIESRAYDLNAKFLLLLTELEKDTEGINKLTKLSDAGITIHHQQYIDGNKGIVFEAETINRLSKLNLGVDIDQYVYGHRLKDID